MSRMNPSGSATVSLKADGELVESFDEWVDGSRYDSRSAALRGLMREAAEGSPDTGTPLVPPSDDDLLETAYRKLCRASNDDGVIKADRARRVLAGGAENLSKSDVTDMVLLPLRSRGYLSRRANLRGDVAWKIVGWDRR
jgi:Arc/MetJ-type ribon-helix-helix transcriptional regulator